ncbi:hypothetical protein PIB30_065024 [Stylosanthes scabra]|uniref:CCHC-type domain-containing protein n=1 Tax=Stylosanthes scabra TaxID=79078 RepID=A0ABU6YJH4_9FABA|nr:hypothetical protein [Stylosanthes scabra]
MDSIHATFKHSIHPVPSEQYWANRDYLKTDAPIIKRPIGRPKVHNRKRDPVENLMVGNKLKRTFRVTCAKCGEQGHNYKTYKGALANPGWTPKTRKNKRGKGATTSNASQEEVSVSQSAPQHEAQQGGTQGAPSQTVAPPAPSSTNVNAPFKPPAQVQSVAPSKTKLRQKQPIRRKTVRSSLPASNPPTSSQGGPSSETMAAASAGTQRILKFMETPGFQKKK